MRIVNVSESNIEDYTTLINNTTQGSTSNRQLTVSQVKSIYFENPGYISDCHLMVYDKEEPVAEGAVFYDSTDSDKKIGLLKFSILSSHYSTNVMVKLLNILLEKSRKNNITYLISLIEGNDRYSQQILESFGFEVNEREFHFRLDKGQENLATTPPKYVIRAARFPQDTEAILGIWNRVLSETRDAFAKMNRESFEKYINFPDIESAFFVAESQDHGIVGIISAFFDNNEIQINDSDAVIEIVSVEENYRRMGIGKALVTKVITWAFENGKDYVSTHLFSSEISAIKLFEKIGFNNVGELIQYELEI